MQSFIFIWNIKRYKLIFDPKKVFVFDNPKLKKLNIVSHINLFVDYIATENENQASIVSTNIFRLRRDFSFDDLKKLHILSEKSGTIPEITEVLI